MIKTIDSLSAVEAMALAQCVKIAECNDVSALPSGDSVEVDFTIRVKGSVSRGEGSSRRATNRARTSNSMIMLLVSSGITRNHSPHKIMDVWRNIGSLDKAAFKMRFDGLSADEQALFLECQTLFETEIVDSLPKIPSKGGVKFDGDILRN